MVRLAGRETDQSVTVCFVLSRSLFLTVKWGQFPNLFHGCGWRGRASS